MRTLFRFSAVALACGMFFTARPQTTGSAIVPGFDTTRDVRNDDGTYTAPAGCTDADEGGTCPGTKQDLGFTVNFFGLSFSQLYINTNGNVTFDSPLPSYTPFNLTSTNRQIIAPFFADVDTRNPASGTVTFGKGTFGGRAAYGVNWIDVGYYFQRVDKKNTFQLILVDRSDTGAGNFDIVFNYGSIQWETGEAQSSGGSNGLGGRSARAGYSNGTGQSGTFLELRGSAIPGSLLDSNAATGLIHGSLNNDVPGRYIFLARNGQIIAGGLTLTGPCPLPTGIQGVTYTPFSLQVAGGTPPYTVTSVLPPGLTLDSTTFTVRGTPTANGNFPISIQVTDSAPGVLQQTREYTCNITISALPPPLSITGPCTGGVQNRPYWVQLGIVGGTGTHSITYNGPSWLGPTASAPSPGVYSYSLGGTPPSPGTFPVTVTVKDTAGTVATYNCAINVTASITITSACPSSPIPQGSSYSYTFNALGGSGTQTWSVVRGQLPPGLSMTSGGRIFGGPTGPMGTSAFTVAVFSGDISDQKACTITVSEPLLRLTSSCPVAGSATVPYGPFPLAAAGGLGTESYKFSVVGTLPEGLTLTGNAISGVPQKEGSYPFSIRVTSGDQTATSACTMVIAAPPPTVVGSCPTPLQQVGTPISAAFSGSGGKPPYNFTFAGPPWLSLNGGAVTGTPPSGSEGGSSFTLTITDSAGVSSSKSCAFNISPPSPAALVGVCPSTPQFRGDGFTLPLAVTGGLPPFAWTYDQGLPSVTLSSPTGRQNSLTGPLDQLGTFTFRVAVTDSTNAVVQPLTCTVTVVPLPDITLATGTVPASLLDPVPLSMLLSSPAAVPLVGTISLSFTSSAAFPMNNPEVTLSNGAATSFTVPAGSTSVLVGNLQRGTVAGTIRLQLSRLADAARSVLPVPPPTLDITVPKIPPVFSVSIVDDPAGIDVVISGYSTTRDITGGSVTVNPKAGSTLKPITIDLSSLNVPTLFADYYATRTPTGAFEGLRIPVDIEGDKTAIESVTVVLINSSGKTEVTKTR